MTQSNAFKVLMSSTNVFLTGIPGSGKSYLIRKCLTFFKARNLKIALTASTGIAASQLGGLTIHSWSGLGIIRDLDSLTFNKIISNDIILERFRAVDILIIDEISMLDAQFLDNLNKLAKYFRSDNRPMGGIKTIFVGDFYQLPPVVINNSLDSNFAFNSTVWEELNLRVCYLTQSFRHNMGDFINLILKEIREKNISQNSFNLLEYCLSKKPKNNITKLYPYNYDVNNQNIAQNNKLLTKKIVYQIDRQGSSKYGDGFIKDSGIIECLELKIGSKVMFMVNNPKEGYLNGSLGVVVDFIKGFPLIRLLNGRYLRICYYTWSIEINNQIVAKVSQLPLKLAWAITIHKSQGTSLDQAEIDLGRSFTPGMGYVALSRVKSIDGLYLKSINKMALLLDNRITKMDQKWQNQGNN
ncbi:MAG: PIF1 family DEAD/DEAH box helicase [Patescibacteria group bacterium]|jgi:ATP-dependent exoDNAse (exonuclease V) alpha subunit|nr:PIF1 family DEAD/DEAH box helicase [Patescibacteria group bacterium]